MTDSARERLAQVVPIDGGPARTYALRGLLGQGGMATVWRGHDPELGRDVAIKVLDGESTPERLHRFLREGRAVAALSHPGVVPVLAAGALEGRPCLIFRLVEGARSLTDAWSTRTLPERLDLIAQVASALAHAHAAGIVHRDVKPDNVLVDASGRAQVNDFGVALLAGEERLTRTGGVVGSLHTMAPEQVAGERDRIGPPTDVWALGVLLHVAATDGWPFAGTSVAEVMAQIVRGTTPSLRALNPEVSPALDAVYRRALQPAPESRFPDAGAFLAALTAARTTRARRPTLRAALCAAILTVAGAAGVALHLTGEPSEPSSGGTPSPPAAPLAPPSTPAAVVASEPAPLSPPPPPQGELTLPLPRTPFPVLGPGTSAVWVGCAADVFAYPRQAGAVGPARRIPLPGPVADLVCLGDTPWLLYVDDTPALHAATLDAGVLHDVWSAAGDASRGARLLVWRDTEGVRLLVATGSGAWLLRATPPAAEALRLDLPADFVRGALLLPDADRVAVCGNSSRTLFGVDAVYDRRRGDLLWKAAVRGTAHGLAPVQPSGLLVGVRETRSVQRIDEASEDPFAAGLAPPGPAHTVPLRDLARAGEFVVTLAYERNDTAAELDVRDGASLELLRRRRVTWGAGAFLRWDPVWSGVWVVAPTQATFVSLGSDRSD